MLLKNWVSWQFRSCGNSDRESGKELTKHLSVASHSRWKLQGMAPPLCANNRYFGVRRTASKATTWQFLPNTVHLLSLRYQPKALNWKRLMSRFIPIPPICTGQVQIPNREFRKSLFLCFCLRSLAKKWKYSPNGGLMVIFHGKKVTGQVEQTQDTVDVGFFASEVVAWEFWTINSIKYVHKAMTLKRLPSPYIAPVLQRLETDQPRMTKQCFHRNHFVAVSEIHSWQVVFEYPLLLGGPPRYNHSRPFLVGLLWFPCGPTVESHIPISDLTQKRPWFHGKRSKIIIHQTADWPFCIFTVVSWSFMAAPPLCHSTSVFNSFGTQKKKCLYLKKLFPKNLYLKKLFLKNLFLKNAFFGTRLLLLTRQLQSPSVKNLYLKNL